jgi:hypothetical protein
MIEVWYVAPTANPLQCGETFAAWQALGYRTAALVDGETPDPAHADHVIRADAYDGFSVSINRLCREGPAADAPIVIAGADDTLPDDAKDLDALAADFFEHFPDGFGIMQPLGDVWGGRNMSLVCDSPWMGRAFIDRINGGAGPFWPEYFHYFNDTELRLVAERLGVFWGRPDVCQPHRHWSRDGGQRPAYLAKAADQWQRSKALFETRRAAGFPGSAPLASPAMARATPGVNERMP